MCVPSHEDHAKCLSIQKARSPSPSVHVASALCNTVTSLFKPGGLIKRDKSDNGKTVDGKFVKQGGGGEAYIAWAENIIIYLFS